MAPVKRKAVPDERPSKKVRAGKGEHDDTSAKKPKVTKAPKSQDEESSERRPPAKSILQQDERAFPRGGASVLTPIEQKQIKAQAERDVLFEQQTGQKAPREDDGEDGDLFDAEAAAAPSKKKRKTKRQGGEDASKIAGSGIRIQGLSYKNLVIGSTVLGYVTAITGRDIALALPNNLT